MVYLNLIEWYRTLKAEKVDGMDGWISPGGPRYRAPYGANNPNLSPRATARGIMIRFIECLCDVS